MYSSKEELIEILKKENLYSQKDLGQNFLVNTKIIDTIIEAASLNKEDKIIEIGPGLGILTNKLLQQSKHVRAIELDRNLIQYLTKTFENNNNFELEQGTALKATLPENTYKLVANIPYYITSPLLRHFLNPKKTNEKRPTLIVLLVQKEVAEKICAKDGQHSILSLNVQIFGKPQIVKSVDKTNFFPQPKVDSAILKIEVFDAPLIKDMKFFSTITRIAFHQRRKTLLNTIKNYTKLSREEIEELFKSINIEPSRRPQTLSIDEWNNLLAHLTKRELQL